MGWGVAQTAVGILVRSAPPDIPRLAEATLDARAFFFAAGAASLAAVAIGGIASELLYGISARDPVVLGSVATFVFVVSWWAAFWPAWSATDGRSHVLRSV
ncbi:MAG TPA: hypothetical protein VJ921_11460 [Vicinamibacteria bacterium]|nr:hypothetical protein [Vicinamibacteria bacterium]